MINNWDALARAKIQALKEEKRQIGMALVDAGFTPLGDDYVAAVEAMGQCINTLAGELQSCVWQMKQCEKLFRDDEEFMTVLKCAQAALAKVNHEEEAERPRQD